MNLKQFEEIIKKDPHSLSDDIRKGKILFSDLSEWMEKIDTPPIIHFSYLINPDCTLDEFKKYFDELRNDLSIMVYKKARIFNNMDVIAYVLNAKDTSKKSIKYTFNEKKFIFTRLIINPYINDDFKIIYYELTDDSSHLPEKAQDIFVF